MPRKTGESPAMYLFPDGEVVLPIPGLRGEGREALTLEVDAKFRERFRTAKAVLGWTCEGIAIVTAYGKANVEWWATGKRSVPLRVVSALEAIVKDPKVAHHLNCLVAARVGRRRQGKLATGRPKKRKLQPGWEKEQVLGRTGRAARAGVTVDLADGGKQKAPG